MKLQNNLKSRKQMYINTVRDYLNSKHITYNEYETPTGSYYFHLNLYNNSHPCIRISDHFPSTNMPHCVSLLYNTGKHTKAYRIKERIIKTVSNTIERSTKYSLHKELEKL